MNCATTNQTETFKEQLYSKVYLLVVQRFAAFPRKSQKIFTHLEAGFPRRAKARGFHPEELDDHWSYAGFNEPGIIPN